MTESFVGRGAGRGDDGSSGREIRSHEREWLARCYTLHEVGYREWAVRISSIRSMLVGELILLPSLTCADPANFTCSALDHIPYHAFCQRELPPARNIPSQDST